MSIYKKYVGFGVTMALFASFAAPASAATLTAAQVQNVVSLLQSYGADAGVIASVQATLQGQTAAPTVNTTAPVPCTIVSTLKLGSSGQDVSCLQKILAQDPNVYPSGLVTGYYGPLTEQAVKMWQASHGIISIGSPSTTGYGVVGPTTLNSLGGGTEPPGSYYYTPPTNIPPWHSGPSGSIPLPSSGCVTSSSGQTTCTTTSASSSAGYTPGSSGSSGGTTNVSCTIPQKPANTCSGGATWNFLPSNGSTYGFCNGAWLCVQGY